MLRKERMTRGIYAALVVAAACGALSGCFNVGDARDDRDPNGTRPKGGELGNGSFAFACDDAVACERWSKDKSGFPAAVATGSTFDVFFFEKGRATTITADAYAAYREGVTVTIDDQRYHGVTTQPVGARVVDGPEGLTAVEPGYATLVARDNRGIILDYVTLSVLRPDALVVYPADSEGYDPPPVHSIRLQEGESERYRTVTARDLSTLAGAVRVEWRSDDPSVATIESYNRGVVRIAARGAGRTQVRVTGAALTKALEVEVTP